MDAVIAGTILDQHWTVLIQQVGVPSAMALVILFMVLPRLDTIRENQSNLPAIMKVLEARDQLFKDLIYADLNECIHTSRSAPEEQLCFEVYEDECSQIQKVEAEVKAAEPKVRK